jgi:hypothetical protein
MGEEVPTAETICGTRPVEVKVKMQKAAHLGGEKANQRVKAAEN